MQVVARMVASLEAETSDFQSKMVAAETQLGRWTSTTATAHRGTRLLTGGLQQMAFGFGGLPPGVSKVATALSMLAIGSPAMLAILGVTAAIAALGMMFDHAAKQAEEFVAAAEKVRDFQLGLVKMMSAIGPGFQMTPAEQLANLEVLRARAIAMQQALAPASFGLARTEVGQDPTEVARAASQRIDALSIAIRGLDRAISTLAAAERARIAGHAMDLPANVMGVTGTKLLGFQPSAQPEKFPAREQFLSELAKTGGKPPVSKMDMLQVAQMAAGSMMMLTSGGGGGAMVGMGTLASGLSGMKGISASLAGPLGWIGLGLTTLGTIFSQKSDAKELADQRRHQELMGVLHEGPMRVTQIFQGGDPATSLYENRREERLGGQPRAGGL